MNQAPRVTGEDVEYLAKVAGVSIHASDTDGIAARLSELRGAVMRMAVRIPEDTGPAVIFDARWEG
jgi:hypothetical protein